MATIGIIDIVNNSLELSIVDATMQELTVMQFGIGAKGDTGDSAYQLAVELGFEGTEQEWIDSLHGGTITTDSLTTISGLLKGAEGKVALAQSGTDYVAPTAITDMITGVGNQNYIPMFLGGSRIITDSGIKYLNGKVGIGIGTPVETLHIDGAFRQSFVKSAALAADANGKMVSLGYTPENQDNKGAAYGYCELDGSGKVPASRLMSSLLKYQSVWNAEDNVPELAEIDTSKVGYVYTVSVGGTRFGIEWGVGDWIIYNHSGQVEKSDNSDDVTSVNGQTGAVVLDADDISDTNTTNKFVTDAEKNTWNNKQDAGNYATVEQVNYAIKLAKAGL